MTEIRETGRPIVFFDTQKKRIRGVFVLPEMADQLIAGTKKKNVSSINALRAGCYACIDSARKNSVLWLREGGGDQHVILAILPPTPNAIKLLDKLYEKNITPDMAQNQTQDTQTEPSPPAPDTGKTSPTIEPQASAPDLAPEPEELASGQMALPVPAPEDKEPETSPAFLMQIFQPETLLGDPDPIPTYDLPDPRDLIQTLRTLFAAVSDIMDHPQTPIRIEYPGNAVLVSADPNIIDYLSYQAESEGHNALKIEARDTAPRDREPIMLVTSFAGAAKGGVCIVPVDGTNIAFLPDDGRFESAQFMQAVLNRAFPQPQGAG